MPTYEYICKKCGLEFELSQPISAAPLKICPKELCGRKKWGRGPVTKKISAGAGLLFKGNGFYITDYRSEGYKKAAKSDTPASSESPKPAESKPETGSKPAAAPTTPASEPRKSKKKE